MNVLNNELSDNSHITYDLLLSFVLRTILMRGFLTRRPVAGILTANFLWHAKRNLRGQALLSNAVICCETYRGIQLCHSFIGSP